MPKFKVGDKVKLEHLTFKTYDSAHNPYWGGKFGKSYGTINAIRPPENGFSTRYKIRWQTGALNGYYEEHHINFLAPEDLFTPMQRLFNTKPYQEFVSSLKKYA